MKYIFLKPFGHKDSSGVCSFVQIHPYFFTIVSASIFLLTLADFACTFMIFKKMLLCRDGFGKNYVCHLILHDLGVSKKYILSVLEIFMVITFPAPCEYIPYGPLSFALRWGFPSFIRIFKADSVCVWGGWVPLS